MRPLLAILLLAMVAACAAPPAPKAALPADPTAALLADLRQGGYVIYLRHAETDTTPEPVVRNLADCAWQRNLNAQGQAQADAIGARLRALSIPTGQVEASPFCRTRQTAERIFGRPVTINADLYYHASQSPEQVVATDVKLKARFVQRPSGGGNLVLVGHAPNMRDVSGVELAEGHGAIVKPNGDGTFRVVGRLDVKGISAGGS